MAWYSIPIVGEVVKGMFGLADKAILDKDKAEQIKSDLTEVFNMSDMTKFSEQIQAQAKIITAEAQGQSWLQRNWRPMLMCLFGVIIANNYILNPWLNELLSMNVVMDVPEPMWGLLKLGVSGYVVGRSVEKGIELWKKKR